MPVDIHPEQGKPGVEVILSTLHAGGKFSDKNYQFSGGLHGVGVSVVNALSSSLEVTIRRDGKVYRMGFAGGDKKTDLEVIDTCGKRNTGTAVTFTPDEKYFDSVNFSVPRLKHVLRAKAVLCPGPAREVQGREEEGRGRGVVLRGRADGLPRRRHHRLPGASRGAVRRQLQRQRGGR